MPVAHSRGRPGFLIVVGPGLLAVELYAFRRVRRALRMLWKENGKSSLGEQYPHCDLVRQDTDGAR